MAKLPAPFDPEHYFNRERITTGLPVLDRFLSPGLPKIGVCEFYGVPGVGKSAIAYQFAGHVLKAYPKSRVLLLDVENATDGERLCQLWRVSPQTIKGWMKEKRLLIYRGEQVSLEDGMELAETNMKAFRAEAKRPYKPGDPPFLVLLDSLAAFEPAWQREKWTHGKPLVGLQARSLSDSFRNVNPKLYEYGVLWLNVNHEKAVPGEGMGWGEQPHDTPGGSGPKYYAGVRLRLRHNKSIVRTVHGKNVHVGEFVRFTVIKHKWAAPKRHLEMPFHYACGFSPSGVAFGILREANKIATRALYGNGPGTVSIQKRRVKFDDWHEFYAKNTELVEKFLQVVEAGKAVDDED